MPGPSERTAHFAGRRLPEREGTTVRGTLRPASARLPRRPAATNYPRAGARYAAGGPAFQTECADEDPAPSPGRGAAVEAGGWRWAGTLLERAPFGLGRRGFARPVP